ncbi:MAG: hypothetical protein KGN78_11680 [Actinomycetales bacterium]|nr:hypothetical protein [Actinomycetales bacterium]
MGRLDECDLNATLPKGQAEERLAAAQKRLLLLRLVTGGIFDGSGVLGPGVCILFEGWDASGKGGAIKALTTPLDPRHVRVVSIAAPTKDEKRHHFLGRFWPLLPGWGGMTILDRSWYGRVLVERVEGFATPEQWQRAYSEIDSLEQTLTDEGLVLIKFWMHISPDEQLRRFQQRERTPLKRWKLTPEDWRNRERWQDYVLAVEEMLARTDTEVAPWHVIPGNDKRLARVLVLEEVNRRIEEALRANGIAIPDL